MQIYEQYNSGMISFEEAKRYGDWVNENYIPNYYAPQAYSSFTPPGGGGVVGGGAANGLPTNRRNSKNDSQYNNPLNQFPTVGDYYSNNFYPASYQSALSPMNIPNGVPANNILQSLPNNLKANTMNTANTNNTNNNTNVLPQYPVKSLVKQPETIKPEALVFPRRYDQFMT